MANKSRADVRRSVHTRIRKKVKGTTERPRLAIYRSTNHIYAQIIDDVSGKTLASASTLEKAFKGKTGGNVGAAEAIGKMIAERAKGAGVEEVVFDRGGYVYHGRVKALIDASREAGLNKNGGNGAAAKKSDAKAEAPAEEKAEAPKKAKKKTKAEAPKKEKKAKKEEKAEAEETPAEESAKSEEE
ncbi:MAG: 50S ribosomal protein L18 [Acidobacteria bacterium]|nr:MAG: 50S ribosomal protein L18 [Acidobacteriota bacterium]REK02529.1 MAG: 50S ribosomal protein L18 [Acidobacteriota bacterium]REK13668.1 MAG: 50S ribosomal protein L18 [Acidobacteriota bacterium]REK41662.1 MAG: 50S ribosomal protein L18 [Acidobacteriota bacterium]